MNSPGLFLFRFGVWTWVVVGIGHLATALLLSMRRGPGRLEAEMRAQPVAVLGRQRSLWAMFQGFSVAMGIAIACCGGLGLLLVGLVPGLVQSQPAVVWLHLGVSVLMLALSVRCFPPPPIFLFSIASVCFALTLVVTWFERS